MLEENHDLRKQIKEWLARDHKVDKDTIDAIALLWAAYDQLGNKKVENNISSK